MSKPSNVASYPVKVQPKPLSRSSGVPSQFICVNSDYIKCAPKRIGRMQTQGTPFAEAETISYNQSVRVAAGNLQSTPSVISKSVRETNDALAEKAEQSGPLYEIPGGRNRQLNVIKFLAQNSENTEMNINICKHSKGTLCENRVLSGVGA